MEHQFGRLVISSIVSLWAQLSLTLSCHNRKTCTTRQKNASSKHSKIAESLASLEFSKSLCSFDHRCPVQTLDCDAVRVKKSDRKWNISSNTPSAVTQFIHPVPYGNGQRSPVVMVDKVKSWHLCKRWVSSAPMSLPTLVLLLIDSWNGISKMAHIFKLEHFNATGCYIHELEQVLQCQVTDHSMSPDFIQLPRHDKSSDRRTIPWQCGFHPQCCICPKLEKEIQTLLVHFHDELQGLH